VLASEKKAENEQQRPKIGDWVQWEHNGILGLPQSKKLVRFSEDGQFGFVEGGNTGLPISEIIPADPPQQSSHQPLLNSVLGGQGAKMRQDVFSLAEGEAVIHWPTPLSDDSIRDLEDWLELVKRKIKRSAAEVSTQQQIETPPGQRQVRLED
jgi:hypothetical protein